MIRVHFEDQGQDFLRWDIEKGEVVDCQPFQGWFWTGTKINTDEFGPGDFLDITLPNGDRTMLRYPVEKIENVGV